MYHVNRGPQSDSEYSVDLHKVSGLSRSRSVFRKPTSYHIRTTTRPRIQHQSICLQEDVFAATLRSSTLASLP